MEVQILNHWIAGKSQADVILDWIYLSSLDKKRHLSLEQGEKKPCEDTREPHPGSRAPGTGALRLALPPINLRAGEAGVSRAVRGVGGSVCLGLQMVGSR